MPYMAHTQSFTGPVHGTAQPWVQHRQRRSAMQQRVQHRRVVQNQLCRQQSQLVTQSMSFRSVSQQWHPRPSSKGSQQNL